MQILDTDFINLAADFAVVLDAPRLSDADSASRINMTVLFFFHDAFGCELRCGFPIQMNGASLVFDMDPLRISSPLLLL